MQHCSGSYSVHNPQTKKWERGLTYTQAAKKEAEYLGASNVVLLPGRMNTRKPGSDARYRNNREMAARGGALTTEAVS